MIKCTVWDLDLNEKNPGLYVNPGISVCTMKCFLRFVEFASVPMLFFFEVIVYSVTLASANIAL